MGVGAAEELLQALKDVRGSHRVTDQNPEEKFAALEKYGQDLTAREYDDRVSESPAWSAWMASPKVTLCRLEAADHTFSRAVWRDQVAEWSREWMLARFG